MIPLMLDVSKYKVLLFGTGKVGFRKIRAFSECKITAVSKNIPEEFSFDKIIETDVSKISDSELADLIKEHDIVITALSDKPLNKKICATAEQYSKLFNSSDGDGNFMLPATFTDGDFTLAVSTNGKAPAVPKFVRDRVFDEFKNINAMIELQSKLRERLKTSCGSQKKRAEILEKILADDEIWEALPDSEKARALAEKYLN